MRNVANIELAASSKIEKRQKKDVRKKVDPLTEQIRVKGSPLGFSATLANSEEFLFLTPHSNPPAHTQQV